MSENRKLTKKLLAEFLGSCFLVMVVIGSGIMAQSLSTDQLSILLANTIATGAGLTALIWIFIPFLELISIQQLVWLCS